MANILPPAGAESVNFSPPVADTESALELNQKYFAVPGAGADISPDDDALVRKYMQ